MPCPAHYKDKKSEIYADEGRSQKFRILILERTICYLKQFKHIVSYIIKPI